MSNILFLVAHPDDVEVCAGGTVARHIDNGDRVEIVFGFMPLAKERKEELETASKFLGYEFGFISDLDGSINSRRHMLSILEDTYPAERFSRVYTMHIGDSHQEHRAIAEIAMSFCRDNLNDLIMCQPAIPGGMTHKPFIPNMYVNIDEYVERKRKAIGIHQSQVDKYSPKRDWVEAVIARDRANGQLIHCQHAEAFEIIKIVER